MWYKTLAKYIAGQGNIGLEAL